MDFLCFQFPFVALQITTTKEKLLHFHWTLCSDWTFSLPSFVFNQRKWKLLRGALVLGRMTIPFTLKLMKCCRTWHRALEDEFFSSSFSERESNLAHEKEFTMKKAFSRKAPQIAREWFFDGRFSLDWAIISQRVVNSDALANTAFHLLLLCCLVRLTQIITNVALDIPNK